LGVANPKAASLDTQPFKNIANSPIAKPEAASLQRRVCKIVTTTSTSELFEDGAYFGTQKTSNFWAFLMVCSDEKKIMRHEIAIVR